jgi:aminoglycoside phosphotransferase (APT) family kinase protein
MNSIGDDATLARKISAFLEQQVGHAVQVGAIRRFPVGFSWLTYAVPVTGLRHVDDSQDLILRLGPDYGLFAPYRAAPQVLAMRSLEGSAVPVPRAFWSSEDASILGAPFLFCERISGSAVVPWVSASDPGLEPGYRRRLGEQFIDALAALHCVRWQEQPIAAIAQGITAENAAQHNVAHWESQIARWAMRPYPLAEWGVRWLKAHAPVAPRVAIVHGDYRTGNFLEEGGRITSILDWELVHLGDPHEDLGWASLPMYMGGSKLISRLAEPDWFYARYGEKAGFEVSIDSLRYYQALSLLKLAATHMAAARCFEEGRFNDMRMPAMGSQIATCLRQMEKTIEAAMKHRAASPSLSIGRGSTMDVLT